MKNRPFPFWVEIQQCLIKKKKNQEKEIAHFFKLEFNVN
jgi:hypothetical protein